MAGWLEDLTKGKVRAPKVDLDDVVGGAKRLVNETTSLSSMSTSDRANLQEDMELVAGYKGRTDGRNDTKTSVEMIKSLKIYAKVHGMDPEEAVKLEKGGREAIVADDLLEKIQTEAGKKRLQGMNMQEPEPTVQPGLPNMKPQSRSIT